MVHAAFWAFLYFIQFDSHVCGFSSLVNDHDTFSRKQSENLGELGMLFFK